MKQLTMKEYSILSKKDEEDLTEEERLALHEARENMEKAISGLDSRFRGIQKKFNDISAWFDASGLSQKVRELRSEFVGAELYFAASCTNVSHVQAVIDSRNVDAHAIMVLYKLSGMSREGALKEMERKYEELQRAASGPSKGGKVSGENRQKKQAEWMAEAQQTVNRLCQEKPNLGFEKACGLAEKELRESGRFPHVPKAGTMAKALSNPRQRKTARKSSIPEE